MVVGRGFRSIHSWLATILFASYVCFSFIKQGSEGINNQPLSEIIQFWKTDFTRYVIPI